MGWSEKDFPEGMTFGHRVETESDEVVDLVGFMGSDQAKGKG